VKVRNYTGRALKEGNFLLSEVKPVATWVQVNSQRVTEPERISKHFCNSKELAGLLLGG